MLITTAEKSGYYPSDYVEMLPDEVAAPAPAPIKPLPPVTTYLIKLFPLNINDEIKFNLKSLYYTCENILFNKISFL